MRGGSLICYFAVMVSEPRPNNERPYPLSTNNHKWNRPLLWEVSGDIRSAVARLQKLFAASSREAAASLVFVCVLSSLADKELHSHTL